MSWVELAIFGFFLILNTYYVSHELNKITDRLDAMVDEIVAVKETGEDRLVSVTTGLQRLETKLSAPPMSQENIAKAMAQMSEAALDKLSVRVFELREGGNE